MYLFRLFCSSLFAPQEKPRPLLERGSIELLGQPLFISFVEQQRAHVWRTDSELTVYGPSLQHKDILSAWLRQQAKNFFSLQATQDAELLKTSFKSIRIKDTRTRWGSCSSLKILNFSWRLILAPPAIARYVCAHEVAHLIEMNHGKNFWALVKKLDPCCHHSRLWLKKNGLTLFRSILD